MKSKKIKYNILLIFVIFMICYMFFVTIASAFGIEVDWFSIGTRRSYLLILLVAIGIIYIIMHKKIIYNNIIKFGFYLAVYMFIWGLFTYDDFASWISCTVIWFLFLFIIYDLKKTSKDIAIVAYTVVITLISMSAVYIYGTVVLNVSGIINTNSIYYILGALPFLFLIKRIEFQLLGLFLSGVAIVVSNKSTCILALIVICIFYIKDCLLKESRKVIIGVSVITVLFSGFIIGLLEGLEGALNELFTGGNGRFDIYFLTLRTFKESSVWGFLFGHGFNAINNAINIGTHNDFLMVLYNYGLFGLVLYLKFWIELIKNIYKLKLNLSPYYFPYKISVTVFFFLSMASNVLNAQIEFLFLCLLWGICSSNKFDEINLNAKYK